MDRKEKLRDIRNSCTIDKEHVGSNNIQQEPDIEMEKENTKDGGNGLKLPKQVGEQGMRDEVQVKYTEKIVKKVQNIGDYSTPITTNEVTNVMQQNKNDYNQEVQVK